MNTRIFLLLTCVGVALCGDCDITTFLGGKFSRCQSLNEYYNLYWQIDGEDLQIALNLQTNQNGKSYQNGWVGFGLSVNGGMRGADIAIARVGKDDKYILEDRFVPGLEGMPQLDEIQNLKLISAESDSTQTTIVFTRKLRSCDVDEDVPISPQGTQVIFAWGGKDFGFHGDNRGSITVYFHYVPISKTLPSDSKIARLTMPEYSVPAKDTTYTCTPTELPADQKYHVVRWRPYITPGSEKYVHHMVIYGCPSSHPINGTYECGMAPSGCSQVVIVWSLGQGGNDWLDDHALPIGAGYVRYVYLQIHYNNPNKISGLKDASGLEITYTSQLRKYDIGILIMSTAMNTINIPPLTDNYTQSAECPQECTSKIGSPVTMINYFPHMHEIGQRMWLQHIRDGVELPEVHRDDHYDFQRQQSYQINVSLVPGDRLKVHCHWNAMSRTVPTRGGESSSMEMCVAVLQYYPIVPKFTSCSDAGMTSGTVSCGGSRVTVSVPYPEYIALPEVVTTCDSEEITDGSNGLTKPAILAGLLVALLVVGLFVFNKKNFN